MRAPALALLAALVALPAYAQPDPVVPPLPGGTLILDEFTRHDTDADGNPRTWYLRHALWHDGFRVEAWEVRDGTGATLPDLSGIYFRWVGLETLRDPLIGVNPVSLYVVGDQLWAEIEGDVVVRVLP